MSELRKIVNDGFNKFKIFEEGQKALNELDALKQATDDLTKGNKELEKTKDKLQSEVNHLQKRISGANAQAVFTVNSAQEEAKNLVDEAQKKADNLLETTNSKLAGIKAEITHFESVSLEAKKEAEIATDKLGKINFELNAAKAKMKALVE